MKTFRYILSMAVLIVGLLVGFLVGRYFVDWAAASVEPSFYFMDFTGTPFPLFFRFSFELMGLLIATYLAIKIWPGNMEKRILHYIFVTDVLFLVSLPLAIVGIFYFYWSDWLSGDRDAFLPLAPYCGCGIGLLIGLVITRFVIVRKAGKFNGSNTNLPYEKDLELTESEVKLYESLRRIRANIAVPKGIPSNTICHDHVLQEMARSRPTNLDTLKKISGVTEEFMKNYGRIFVDEISSHIEDDGRNPQ